MAHIDRRRDRRYLWHAEHVTAAAEPLHARKGPHSRGRDNPHPSPFTAAAMSPAEKRAVLREQAAQVIRDRDLLAAAEAAPFHHFTRNEQNR